jgi:hypothetical protein
MLNKVANVDPRSRRSSNGELAPITCGQGRFGRSRCSKCPEVATCRTDPSYNSDFVGLKSDSVERLNVTSPKVMGVNAGTGDEGPFSVPAYIDLRYPTPIWLAETEVPAVVSDKLTVAPARDLCTILKESWSPATVGRLAERGPTLCRKLPITSLNWPLAD